jgi:crotonobetaine/carnitine-CoA ligase
MTENVATVLAKWADRAPERDFLVFEDEHGAVVRRSYEDIFERARCTAGLLAELGVGRGDRVHLHLPNLAEFFDLWFGCAVLGAVMIPTNYLLTVPELAYELEHSRPRLSVTTPELSGMVKEANAHTEVLITGEAFERRSRAADPMQPVDVVATDPLAVLYTSGTTSRPKGVIVTHANYLHVGEVMAQHLRIQPDDRWLIVLPLFHANAQYYSTMSALVAGASVAVMPRFSASAWVHQAVRHEATLASLFATPIRMILAQPASPEDSSNRLRAVTFSQNVTEAQLQAFELRFGVGLMQLYGMTETIAPPTINPLEGERRNMSIGKPLQPDGVKLVDGDGTEVPEGVEGEIVVAGESGLTLMAGYLDDPEATAEAVHGGRLYTGDVGRADADGFVYFVDRAKDMIKRGGENVSAGEVEAVVNQHPAVLDSAAVGVPDDLRDEAIVVYCVLEQGEIVDESEIVEWCRERLAKFKVPGSVRFVESLPRTSVGKVQKELLRRGAGRRGGGEG